MDAAEKERMEKLAIDAAINEAMAENGARAAKVLYPHVRAACRVSWVEGVPVVTCTKNGTDEVRVDTFVAEMKFDKDFAVNFYKPPNPDKKDDDGIRRISVTDQASLNRFAEEIAQGKCEVVYPPETKKILDDNQVDRRDQGALNANLEQIASGEKVVV